MLSKIKCLLKTSWSRWHNLPLWGQIFIALSLGIILGLLFGDKPLQLDTDAHGAIVNHLFTFYTSIWPYGQTVIHHIWPIGQLFLNGIKMMIVPVVFVSIVCGVISIANPKLLGKIGLRTVAIYLATMAGATVIGLISAQLFQPGNIHIPKQALATHGETLVANTSVTDILVNLIPSNPVAAFANNDILQIVIFAAIFGIAIILSGKKGKVVSDFFQSLSVVVMYIPRFILQFAPYGVFALMATNTAHGGSNILGDIFLSIAAMYTGCIFLAVFVYSAILTFVCGLSPVRFFRGMLEAIVFAFSTTSSAATLPYTIHCAQHNLGVSKRIANFVMPLGATVNMNGLAVYLGVAVIFASDITGTTLSTMQLVTVIVTGTLAAIGAAGVPGTALVVMTLVMGSVGFTPDVIAIVLGFFAGIDRILDMMATTLNVTGDGIASVVVAKMEGELDEDIYNHTVTKTRKEVEESLEAAQEPAA